MIRKIEIEGIGPAARLSLDLAPRLNVLTGDNGLGKTLVLDAAWYLLTNDSPGEKLIPSPGSIARAMLRAEIDDIEVPANSTSSTTSVSLTFEPSHRSWSVSDRSRNTIVLYGTASGGVFVNDPLRSTFDFSPSELFDGYERAVWGGGTRLFANGLIRDWISWQFQKPSWFEALAKALVRLSPPAASETIRPGKPTRISVLDPRDIPTIELSYGQIPITHASAAFRRIVGLAYALVWAWFEHLEAVQLTGRPRAQQIVLLVDEIEAHLHPQWQRVILPALLDVVNEITHDVAVQVVVSTHSPLVLASLEPLYDEEKDELFRLALSSDGSHAELEPVRWRSRGDANAWLTSDVFGLKQARSREAEVAIEAAKKAMSDPTLPLEDVKQIHEALIAVLKDTDPFWARWLYRAEQAGLAP